MKQILLLSCWVLSAWSALAQAYKEQVDAPTLGKTCPNVVLPVMVAGGIKPTALADYRGKVVVLEFWATSCRPCIPAMNHFEILEAAFPNQLKVFEITVEERNRVERFLQKQGAVATIVLDSTQRIREQFYHHFLPHTVVIDPKGVIRAFTYPSEITPEVIQKLLQGKEVKLRLKQELDPNAQATVSSGLNRDLNEVESILFAEEQYVRVENPKRAAQKEGKVNFSDYQEGKEAEIYREDEHYLSFVNCPLTLMYESLYEISSSRVLLDVPENHVEHYTFDKANAFCLELSLADTCRRSLLEVGKQELEKRFPLRSRLENRSRPVWVLQKIGKAPIKHPNNKLYGTFKDLLAYLENFPDLNGMPLINETGLADTEPFEWEIVKNQTGTLDQRLAALGLKRVEKIKEVQCLILFEAEEK
ncbi:MAG: TlpA disulfide reductase family protein [Spirosomataceae bacterium]